MNPPLRLLLLAHAGLGEGLLDAATAILGERPPVDLLTNRDRTPAQVEMTSVAASDLPGKTNVTACNRYATSSSLMPRCLAWAGICPKVKPVLTKPVLTVNDRTRPSPSAAMLWVRARSPNFMIL